MITIKIIKEGYGHKSGQVLTLNEFDAGHLMAFGYAENYVKPKIDPPIETQMVTPPDVREKSFINQRQDPVKIIVEPERKKIGIFGKRGRPKKGN